ncbi:mitotic-spindle organizing protein 1-like [Clavelina lepadiformis]|uniref:Mitotic-spindle organizing protein 1 n=1 Tax=Clavelina lepadiformis TaxID=159417 RepID=A0ABP0FA35_CLALP
MDSAKPTAEAMDTLLEISRILNTGLDAKTLSVCVQLCELGINPEAIATVIKEIRTQTTNLETQKMSTTTKK